ncbi:hypothetical protein J1780_04730 [Rahnella aceris]|uniref:DUF6232 family protein n=1 Tax=Rahnella sp. (strain Y9602) TaxID=2703885 RepID=UPI001C27ECAB|nr:DUF6232 family protein [Rahnella aceris]MBU9839259.1 hypothetical protein [Rahnella aceris]
MGSVEINKKKSGELWQGKNILVTNTHLIVGTNTYVMSEITSVRKNKLPAEHGLAFFATMIGLIVLCSFESTGWEICGGVILLGGVISFFATKPTYSVSLCHSSVETEVYYDKDEGHINAVINALNKSIVQRG